MAEIMSAIISTMGVLFCPAKRSGCVNCGHTKNLRKKFEQLKLKAEGLYSVRDAIQEVMNRELMKGKLITSECQRWLEVVDEIEIEVKRINVEIDQDTRCLRVGCFSNLLDKDVANMMDEISVHLEKSIFERSSMVHGLQDGGNSIISSRIDDDRPQMMVHGLQDGGNLISSSRIDDDRPQMMVHGLQDGGNSISSSRMDDDRPEMMVHGPQDKGKAIIGSLMDADMSETMVQIPQNIARTISSSRSDDHRSEKLYQLTERDEKGKNVDSWSNAEATVISEGEITPAENAKGPVEQKKAGRTRKTFSIEEMIERKEAAQRKVATRKGESGQRRVRRRRKSGQVKETQQKKGAETSLVWFSEGESTATQAIESVDQPEQITITPPTESEIMSEPSDDDIDEIRRSKPLQSSKEIELSKALEESQSSSMPMMGIDWSPEQNPLPRMDVESKPNPINVSREQELKPEIEMEMISSERKEDFEPELETESISLEHSEEPLMKIPTRGKTKRGLLSILKRKAQSRKKSETPSAQLVESEKIPMAVIKSSRMPEHSTLDSTPLQVPSNELMPEQGNTVCHISSSNEEHKEVVLVDSSSSLSRARKLEHLDGILSPFSGGYYYMIKENMGLTEVPKEKEWLQAHVISLMGNKLSVLPESPKCERLLKLSLKRNYRLRAIPESFFKYMPMLQVLDLSETRIKSLPLSFELPSLRVLLLRDCERFVVLPPQVGSLKSLEILDLQGTNIKELPNEVGELTRLVTLQLSFQGYDTSSKNVTFPSELIPGGILSNLFLLKDISIVVDPEDPRWNENVKSVTNELGNLNELSTLHFYFPEEDCLERFLQISTSWNARSMSKFRFIVGHHVKRFVYRVPNTVELEYEKRDKCLRFVNGKNVPNALVEVLKYSTAFYLDRHCGLYSLSDIGMENMKNLEFCIIRECHEIKTLIDELEVIEGVLPSLEHLKIHYSQNLTSICKGFVQPGSLIMLKSLALYTCPKLSYIFTLSMFHSLSNLEEMVIEDCQSLKMLISEEMIQGDIVVTPRLKRLSLRYLPELVSMGKTVSSWHSLENINIFNCQNLKNISLDSKSAANIKEIKGEKDWWSALEWEESAILLQLGPRFIPISDDALLKSD